MYNLLISLGIAVAVFALASLVVGSALAGFVPALIALIAAYFLLARRTGRQLEDVMKIAMKEFEANRVDAGRRMLEAALPLGKWQFLVEAQIHAQLGSLDYMQRHYKEARAHLNKAWSRHWMAQAMLACLDFREKQVEAALARMEKTTGPGEKEAVFWGLYAHMALEKGDRELALKALARGLDKNPGSEALQGMADAVRNKKKIRYKPFAPGWYQFFPEHMSRAEMMELAQQRGPRPGQYRPPMPRR